MQPPGIAYPFTVGPFVVSEPIAAGGMATIHLAMGNEPHAPLLALKRLHPQLECDDLFRKMLLDEGAINRRIRHPNVVATHGVASLHERLFLVMDYVEGVTLYRLMAERLPGVLPARVVVAIVADVLRGLHAAHEAVGDDGSPLGVIHRDVSPQNILVGSDGVARVLDFGVAKAERRLSTTRQGEVKGKLAYMAPEQINDEPIDRRADVYAAGIVLWEALTGIALFDAEDERDTIAMALAGCKTLPSHVAIGIPRALDEVVNRALAVKPSERFATALEMADALEAAVPRAEREEIARWVTTLGAPAIQGQARVRLALQHQATKPPPRLSRRRSARLRTIRQNAGMFAAGAICFFAAMLLAVAVAPLVH